MDERITIAQTSAGKGATGPSGRSISLSIAELTRGCGLITGTDAGETGAVLAEALANRNLGLLIVDGDGAFTASSTWVDAIHCGSDEDCDVRLESVDGERLAETAPERDLPVVLDLSEATETDAAAIDSITKALLRQARMDDRPFLVLFSNIDAYLPVDNLLGETSQALRTLLMHGCDYGIGVCCIVDRPADVAEEILSAINWSIWHQLSRTADTSVVRRILDGEHARAMRDLNQNEAILATDWNDTVERIITNQSGNSSMKRRRTVEPDILQEIQHETTDFGVTERLEDLETVADRLENIAERLENHQSIDELAGDITSALRRKLELPASDADSTFTSEVSGIEGPNDDGPVTPTNSESSTKEAFGAWNDMLENGEGKPRSSDESTEKDGLAALAGVGTDTSGESTSNSEITSDRSGVVGDGGLNIDSLTTELAEFEDGAAAVNTTAEAETGRPAVVVDLDSTFADFDETGLAMLEYFRSEGPARPEDAHRAVTGRERRISAYTLNRRLRRAGLVQHVGQGRYEYSLRDRIEAGLPPDRNDEMAAVYARDLEQEYLD